MKIKALIETDDLDVPAAIGGLEKILHDLDIDVVQRDFIEDDIFYIYFRNPYIRYPDIHNFIKMIESQHDYPCVKSNSEIVGISKKYLKTPYIQLNNFPIIYTCPGIAPIPIIVYTHKRADYLRLSLNSLIYALGDEIYDLTIFMSCPSIEVEKVVQDFSKNPFITVLKSENNIACSAINAYLQIKRPDKFIIFEEDFILPPHTRYVLPCWSRRFYYLLDKYDIVNFQTSLENTNICFFNDFLNVPKRTTTFSFTHEWITDKTADIHMTGNGLASNTKFYTSLGNNPPFYISGDGKVFSEALSTCTSNIHGYHIGWNQEMDGYSSFKKGWRFPHPHLIQNVQNVKTGGKFTINLKDIIKL